MSCSCCQFVLVGWTCDGCGEVKTSQSSRRFRHRISFGDSTDYLECLPDGTTWFVDLDGTRRKSSTYNLAMCLDQVEQGVWVEISGPSETGNTSAILGQTTLQTLCTCGHRNGRHGLSGECMEFRCRCMQFNAIPTLSVGGRTIEAGEPDRTPDGLDIDLLASTFEWGDNRCRDRGTEGFYCTRTAGHSGLHVAHCGHDQYVSHWSNENDPDQITGEGTTSSNMTQNNRCRSSLVGVDDVERRCIWNIGHPGPHRDVRDNAWPSGSVHFRVVEENGQYVSAPLGLRCGSPSINHQGISVICHRLLGHEGSHCTSTDPDDSARYSWTNIRTPAPISSILRDGTVNFTECGAVQIGREIFSCRRPRGHRGSHCTSTDVNDATRHSWEG